MAKASVKQNTNKTVFGVRKGGKAQKSKGPKDKSVSKYVGQGR